MKEKNRLMRGFNNVKLWRAFHDERKLMMSKILLDKR